MADLIKRIQYNDLVLGDIVRCTQAVHGSKGRRYKFLGAIFDASDPDTPLHLEVVDIKSGNVRSVRPEFVVQEVASSKAARARKARKEAK
jgi:hypothetical protein